MSHNVTDTVISVGVGILVAVAIVGGALTTFFTTTTTAWSSSVAAIWGLLAILAVLAIALTFYGAAKRNQGKH